MALKRPGPGYSKFSTYYPEITALYETLGFQPASIAKVLDKRHPELKGNQPKVTMSGFYQYLKRRVCELHDWKLAQSALDKQQKREEIDKLPTEKALKDKCSWEEKQDSASWSYDGYANITTLEEALAFSKVDLSIWEVDRHVFNTWTTTYKDANKEAQQKWNVQVKVWFKKKTHTYKPADFKKDLAEVLNGIKKPRKFKKFNITAPEKLAFEVDVFDAHLGKLAWAPETGSNYDLKLAEAAYYQVHDDLFNQVRNYQLSEILIPVGNDFFHIDNIFNTTTSGTAQDVDGRFQKSWKKGVEVSIQTALMWAEVAPVKILMVAGNHDFERTYYLGETLERYFENHKNITVDNSPTIRKYWKFGKTGIMHTHGYWGKPDDYPVTMLAETKKMGWKDVDFMEVHHGHFHKSKKGEKIIWSDEIKGIQVRCLRSISGTDAWHFMQQYVCNIRGAEGFVYSSQAGIKANLFSNL